MNISETLKNKLENEKSSYVTTRSATLQPGIVTNILKKILRAKTVGKETSPAYFVRPAGRLVFNRSGPTIELVIFLEQDECASFVSSGNSQSVAQIRNVDPSLDPVPE